MKKSIRTHLALLFALLALAPIAMIFAIYSPGVLRALNSNAIENLQSLGKSHVNIASLWIEEKIMDVERIAVSPPVQAALAGQSSDRGELSGFLRANLKELGLSGIYVFDKDDNLKASEKTDGHVDPHKDVKQLLDCTRKGICTTWAGLHQTDNAKDGCPALFVARPILAGKDTLGTIVAHLDLSKLREILDALMGGKEVCSLLVDREGRLLTCLMLDPSCRYNETVGKKLADPGTGDLVPIVKACLSEKGGFSPGVYTNYFGEKVVGAWGWIPELDAGLILEVKAREFFEPVSMVKKRLWSLLLIVGIGLVVVSIFVSRRVSEPILSLTQTAKKIAAGNLKERSSIKSQDELGELAESLNTMVESIQREHAELEEANKKLAATAIRDGLTGLYNHYRFQEMLDSEYRRAKRYDLPLCLIMMDIDNFKLINDTYGHPFGDFILKEITHIINDSIRDTDIASRYGGEEFTVILPNATLDGAFAVAEKLRHTAADYVFSQADNTTRLTLTIGISSLAEEEIKTKDDMVKHADEAMYEGKIRGKNMVVSWGEFILWERLAAKKEEVSTEHYRKRFMSTANTMKRSYMEAATTLVKTLEAKDGYSATHSYLVATYAVRLAEELGLSREKTEIIKNSAILQDVGKIAIPSGILTKTDKLTEEEYNILKTHPEQSARVLEGIGFLEEEIPIILYHQEWFNGEGYPSGLKGTAIPLGARILAICDAYAAMTSKRPYRGSLTHKDAAEEIRRGAGRQYDPHLIEPFVRAMEKLLATTRRIYIPQLNKTVDIS
ncbi:MAG: hypothetical protein A3I59_04145 [Planctomycetes bacterium RIFCSPLOWO2_02_FULL_50_16]|nr:MAG: hypothetical protein A3I59_04145 [Planctomycetes bacterium RIFCSPLOWO2_02_FULL_50_16]